MPRGARSPVLFPHGQRKGEAAQLADIRPGIHSLFSYIALQHPEHAATAQRVLAIPPKRTGRNIVTYLTEEEATALLGACDQQTWTGSRDHAMFALASRLAADLRAC